MTQSQPRILFMGTPDFAVPILQGLMAAGFSIVGVVTQPDKPVGRRRQLTPPPVKQAALAAGLCVLQPARVREADALQEIALLEPDVIVTAAYGQLLPQRLLDIPRVGCLNVHASLLPRWRGAAPIHRALLAGDSVTGVTIMEMVLDLDAGPIVVQESIDIAADDNVGTLHDKLSQLGSRLITRVIPEYVSGSSVLTPQSGDGVTYASRILTADEHLDWTLSADEIHNHVRGLCPWPGARTTYNGQTVKVWRTGVHSPTAPCTAVKENDNRQDAGLTGLRPGYLRSAGQQVFVQCGTGCIELLEVQPAGKRRMPADAWMRGLSAPQLYLGDLGDNNS